MLPELFIAPFPPFSGIVSEFADSYVSLWAPPEAPIARARCYSGRYRIYIDLETAASL
jgi:hypothetical protein